MTRLFAWHRVPVKSELLAISVDEHDLNALENRFVLANRTHLFDITAVAHMNRHARLPTAFGVDVWIDSIAKVMSVHEISNELFLLSFFGSTCKLDGKFEGSVDVEGTELSKLVHVSFEFW